jgi:hypothetical protein
MFQLSIIAFSEGVDITILRILIAFFIFEDLKTLDPPLYPSFQDFQLNKVPTHGSLINLIEQCYKPYNCDSDFKQGEPSTSKQRRAIEAESKPRILLGRSGSLS